VVVKSWYRLLRGIERLLAVVWRNWLGVRLGPSLLL